MVGVWVDGDSFGDDAAGFCAEGYGAGRHLGGVRW